MTKENTYMKVIFIVVERHMMANYTYLDSILKELVTNYQVVFLPEIPSLTIKNRIKNGRKVLAKLKDYCMNLFPNGIEDSLILYSNGEGFLLSNKTIWMPQLSGCREVALQHGLMPLDYKRDWVRNLVNAISSCFLGFNLLGDGFGGVHTDKFIVWGKAYADLMTNRKGWNHDDIIISGASLKPLFKKMPHTKNNSCLFLLQDVSTTYIKNFDEMLRTYEIILKNLCSYYDSVIVRKHPKMDSSIYNRLCTTEQVKKSVGSLYEDVISVNKVYSFFSSALIDAYLMGREIVAIHLKGISSNLYYPFSRVVEVEDLKDYLTKHAYKDDEAVVNQYYYDSTNNTRGVIEQIIKK